MMDGYGRIKFGRDQHFIKRNPVYATKLDRWASQCDYGTIITQELMDIQHHQSEKLKQDRKKQERGGYFGQNPHKTSNNKSEK